MEGCLNHQLSSSKEDTCISSGIFYVFKQGGNLNSGYGKIGNFAAVTVFPTATPAGSVRTLQLVANVLFQHLQNEGCCFFLSAVHFLSLSSAVKS